jgi:hypothetical protein
LEKEIMDNTVNFEPDFEATLPQTYALITSGCFVVHPAVSRITLHGSRGLGGGCRPDSDIDLSLIVDALQTSDINGYLQEVIFTTSSHWQGEVELDLAVIFDTRNCRLACFEQRKWDDEICLIGGMDCFGLYKIHKGFTGLVRNAGIQVPLMYPCLKIWQRQ